jgi:glycine/D-amino acid oxidase-like deaminating enzyme
MSERVDVAILGGGMAGITAALEARTRGARVMLFEPGPIGGT